MTKFAQIPVEVFQDKRLTLWQIRVLGVLMSFKNKRDDTVWPSRQQIADRCRMHISNVSDATSALVKLGWLEKEGKGGHSKSTTYKIKVPDLLISEEETVAESTTVDGQTTVAESATVSTERTVAESATVAESTTVVQSATVVESTTVAESTRGVVAESTTPPVAESATRYLIQEQTSEQTSEQTIVARTVSTERAPKPKASLSPEMKLACSQTWEAYCAAYASRYGIEPVKNAKVAGQVVNFVKRVGMSDAPFIAGWFPAHRSAYYIGRGHTVDCLLKDAEKLRTEWATGRSITNTQALQADRTAANLGAANEALSILQGAQA